MKNWIKTQLATFPTEGLISGVFKWAFTLHLLALGAINIYLGINDHIGYFIAGTWQIWGALMYWMFLDLTNSHSRVRDCYRQIIKLQDEQIDHYHKAFLEIDKLAKEEKKTDQVS